MTAPVGTLIIGYRTRLAACQRLSARRVALLAGALTVALPCTASAQRIDGSIGVSLTILPPAADQSGRLTAFHVDRDGVATVRTTRTTTAYPSQMVVTRIIGSANGLVCPRHVPALPCSPHATGCTGPAPRHKAGVDSSTAKAGPCDVQRTEYLVVPGT